jgi:hypothetical protein
VELAGYRFASHAEARRYQELLLMAKAGQIHNLRVHPSWRVEVNGQFITRYTADFAYFETREDGHYHVVEDVKGAKTTDASRLRMKLMAAVHGIQVREIRPARRERRRRLAC